MRPARVPSETLNLLYWSLMQPAAFRRALREDQIELERARWEGLALAISVPVIALLLLHGVASVAHLPINTAGARTLAQVSIAIASVLCLVGSVPEGVAFGIAGGLVGVLVGSTMIWLLPFPLNFSVVLGTALGTAYRTRCSDAGTWLAGIREAIRGGFVFAIVFGLEEGGFLFFSIWPGSELIPAFLRFADRFASVSWQTGLYFALPFLLFYLGLLWYPLEFVWAALARNSHPAHYDHLIKLPLPAPSTPGKDTSSRSR